MGRNYLDGLPAVEVVGMNWKKHAVKRKTGHTGMRDRVRAAARALSGEPWFSRMEVFNRAEIFLPEFASFKNAWMCLRRRGELVKMGREKYYYNPEKAARPDVKNRIFRAMHVKGAFCASDIAKLSEADLSYAHMAIRELVSTGWLEFTGKKGKFKFFRVRNSERFYLEFVK